jgi:hypothetical protein
MKNTLSFLFSLSLLFSNAQSRTEVYIKKFSSIAIEEMNRYNIPASITLAQGILESGIGESRLAIKGNNHFGIKCHDNWNGESIIEDDDEKGECFRKYAKATDSYRDHSLFLTERGRYSFLFEYKKTDYKKWAKGLKKAGYATNPEYSTLLIDLIERNNLGRFDNKSPSIQKNFYLAHSYGLPYLTGLGTYYFNRKVMYSAEINTSFMFSEANIGYHYEILNKFYAGTNSGIIYLPTKERDFIPQITGELIFRKKSILIRGGLQLPLNEMEYKLIPYLKLTYLINYSDNS